MDNFSNLTATDILIISIASDASIYDSLRIANIIQYLQQGGKVYLQSEFNNAYYGNIAFQTIVNSFGSLFEWSSTSISGFLNPLSIVGSIATDSSTTNPIVQSFWWGNPPECDDGMEHFLEHNGIYYGFIYCIPNSNGRIITISDQDLIQNYFAPDVDSLLRNIIVNLSKPSYACDLSQVICKPTSLQSNNQQNFSIFPQPAFETLTVSVQNEAEIFAGEIINLQGDLIPCEINQRRIDVSALHSGLYFLRIKTKQHSSVVKFIKL